MLFFIVLGDGEPNQGASGFASTETIDGESYQGTMFVDPCGFVVMVLVFLLLLVCWSGIYSLFLGYD